MRDRDAALFEEKGRGARRIERRRSEKQRRFRSSLCSLSLSLGRRRFFLFNPDHHLPPHLLPFLFLFFSSSPQKTTPLQKNSRRAAAPRTTRAVVERPAVSGGAASIASRSPSSSVLAVILGGGAGTRLYPLTKQRAKPAVPIGGAYRLIDVPMSNCINSGSCLCFF